MLQLLGDVASTLDRMGVPHALVGAAALAVHGVSRSTFDVDLLVIDSAVLAPAAWAGLAAGSTVVDVRVGDAEDPLAGVVRFSRAGQRAVDLVVGRHAWQGEMLARALPARVGAVDARVVTPADLVLLKLYAGGPQDAWDVQQLLAAVGRDAIGPAVEAALARLPAEARALWGRIRG